MDFWKKLYHKDKAFYIITRALTLTYTNLESIIF
jgi:hypothetical protein